jgi:hypothetical protein
MSSDAGIFINDPNFITDDQFGRVFRHLVDDNHLRYEQLRKFGDYQA